MTDKDRWQKCPGPVFLARWDGVATLPPYSDENPVVGSSGFAVRQRPYHTEVMHGEKTVVGIY
ncbi:hypothetical protein QBK99_15830 [Corticibacterium sp. UT-5YL-CI-8]|nr:hypothetical protein [Tianweitania sp. UT-5YL-CI-8]